MIEKHSTAVWKGTLKDGAGKLTTQSGTISDLPYTFATRFEGAKGSNPEELIGAAHAGCYAMFLSALMSGEGIVPERIEATSTIGLDPTTEGGPTVKTAHLVVRVKAPAEEAKVLELAEKAKAGCPISKLLNAKVTMEVAVG
ncbi:OsmC family peroxiredoxin [Paragemmobacter straminiformis]|uniref:OsmC family peroxiredoxin n=1 Tax=Paragemmobacter straminiformis TaxID=2045119 RepID=A0A842IAV3_9RHOB|nr:OsmC family peroxiredoxin [Gemmobacter straminiformis]MBC2836795.1 OsmC family peroxiredoxin [Gemmobacter straminiformis]